MTEIVRHLDERATGASTGSPVVVGPVVHQSLDVIGVLVRTIDGSDNPPAGSIELVSDACAAVIRMLYDEMGLAPLSCPSIPSWSNPALITLLDTELPVLFVLVPIIVVSLIGVAVTYGMRQTVDWSDLWLKIGAVLVTELIVAVIISGIGVTASGDIRNSEDRMGQAFLFFFLGLAWLVSFAVSIPAVLIAHSSLKRR